jgi:ABC-type sugar transport system ATPase subunit
VASLRLHGLGWTATDTSLTLDLTVESGEVAVVLTDRRAAASLADVLLGLELPDAGEILVGDRDVVGLPPGRRGIALVPAGGGLLPHLTVERNVEYAGGDAPRWMRRLTLEGISRFRPHELSPVQCLQVALARALSTEPSAVVFEDRAGNAPCRTAVAGARQHAAVLVITDSQARGAAYGGVMRPARATPAARAAWPEETPDAT